MPSQAANAATAEPVFPGDADIVYGQTVHRTENRDIDLYQFTVTEPGLFRSETIAERLPNASLLNTVLTLYQESSDGKTRTQIARNDDYYGNDSYLEVHLEKGTYYLAVTSVEDTDFDPTIADTGFGGRTQGAYNLSLSLKPDGGTVSMRDATGVAFDGDAENNPGGSYQFWFQANTADNTVYVDKTPPASPSGARLDYQPLHGARGSAGGRQSQHQSEYREESGADCWERRHRWQCEHLYRRQALFGGLQGRQQHAALVGGRWWRFPSSPERHGDDRRRSGIQECGARI